MDRRDKHFPTQEELINELKSKMDDVESVVLPIASELQVVNAAGHQVRRASGAGGQIKYINGESIFIHRDDMEAMINDGVFQRIGIKIKLKPC